MGTPLKQSAATYITIGPLIAASDFKTPRIDATAGSAGMDSAYMRNHGAWTAATPSTVATATWGFAAKGDGFYALRLGATHTGTLGELKMSHRQTGVLPWADTFFVVPANTYDSLYAGTDYLQVDAEQIGGVDHISATIGTVTRANSLVTGTVATVGQVSSVISGTIAQVNSVISGTIATVGKVNSVVTGTVATCAQVSSVVSGTISTVAKVTSLTNGTITLSGAQYSAVAASVWSRANRYVDKVTSLTSGTIATCAQVSSVVSGTVGITGNVTTAATSNTAIATAILAATAYSESAAAFTTSGVLTRLLAKARNKRVVKSDTEIVYKDDGSTAMLTHTLATVSGTFTRGEAT